MMTKKYTGFKQIDEFIQGLIILANYGDPKPYATKDGIIYCGDDTHLSDNDNEELLSLEWWFDDMVYRWAFQFQY